MWAGGGGTAIHCWAKAETTQWRPGLVWAGGGAPPSTAGPRRRPLSGGLGLSAGVGGATSCTFTGRSGMHDISRSYSHAHCCRPFIPPSQGRYVVRASLVLPRPVTYLFITPLAEPLMRLCLRSSHDFIRSPIDQLA